MTTTPSIEEYTVRIDAFQGPLDLLLYLIRRAEVDITDIPIAEITEQFLTFLKDIDRIDIDAAGEFLVMAASLMEIKSRMLMPPPKKGEGEGEGEGASGSDSPGVDSEIGLDQADPRYELVRQLLAYKKFRDAARELDERREIWAKRFPLTPARVGQMNANANADGAPEAGHGAAANASRSEEPFDPDELDQSPHADQNARDLEDVSVWDLAGIFQRIIAAVDFGRLGEHRIEYDDTPVELHAEDLFDQLSRAPNGRLSLREAFQGRTRGEAIGLFLATLELVRQRRVIVKQSRIHDDIVLLPVPDDAREASDDDEDNDINDHIEGGDAFDAQDAETGGGDDAASEDAELSP